MRRINYKSDIPPLLLSLKVDEKQITVPDCDFIVRFYIDGYEGRHYDCSHIGGVWSNCEPSEDGTKLVCYINNQRLGIGELCAEFHYISPNKRYSDGSQKSVVIIDSTELGVELVEDNGDAVTEAAIDVTLPFIYRTAYEIARDHGYTGTADDFYSALASVVGIAEAEAGRVSSEELREANEQQRVQEFDAMKEIVDELEWKVDGVVEDEKSFEDAIRDQLNNYKPIVIEGNVTNAADEEDITSENGLLKLKGRSALNGIGYIILRIGKSIKEQLTQANTIYEVRYDFDLNGEDVIIPEGCTLKFEGGSIYNGSVFFNQTILLNAKFVNCYLTGDIHTREIISDNSFLGDNRYDVSILAFLLKNCIQNNTILDLNRNYSINYDQCVKIPSVGICFSCAYNNEGFTINGNGHTIHETIMSDIGEFNHFFIYIEKCNNVKVTGLTYRCDYTDGYLDSYDKKESSGATIIYTAGDCGNCYFDLCGFRVSTIVRAGAFGNDYERNEDGTIKVDDTGSPVIDGTPTPNHVHRGIHDSKFILKGYHVGYTVAVYTGENLDVVSYFNGAHRGIYLTGVNNSKIVAKGKNVRTPVIVMLGESVYYDIEDVNFVHPKFKPCSNIECDITDTGSRKIKDDDPGYENWPNNVYTTGLHIRPYGKGENAFHFNKRNYAHHFSNIRCTIRRENITEESTQLTAVIVTDLVKSLGDTCSVEIIDSVLDAVPSIDSSTEEGLKLPFNLINVSSQAETDGDSIDDKTLVNVKLNRIIAPESNCIMDSPFNADFSSCKIKNIIIREYEKKNILRFTDSEFYVISTYAQVSNTVVETTNTSYTDIPVKYVNVDDGNVAQTLAKVEDIDLSNLLKFNQYYVEVSNNKIFSFTNESLKKDTKVTILVKNIGQSSIYISLSSASWITTSSTALQVRPQEVVTLNVMNISGVYRVAHIRGEYSNLRAVADGSMPSNGVVDGAEIYNITLRKTAYWSVARGKWLLSDGYTMGRREGESSARPSLDGNDTGLIFFDTTLNCPVWWTGTKWVDATGAEV